MSCFFINVESAFVHARVTVPIRMNGTYDWHFTREDSIAAGRKLQTMCIYIRLFLIAYILCAYIVTTLFVIAGVMLKMRKRVDEKNFFGTSRILRSVT